MKTSIYALFSLFLSSLVYAQIPASGIYTQNFDSLASTGTTQVWADNSTLLNWYAAYNFTNPVDLYIVRNGLSGGISPNSYGLNSDRAFGTGGSSGS